MFQGVYHGSSKHSPDLSSVLNRSWDRGLERIIITGTSLSDSSLAIELSKSNERLYCTVGCHPTRCDEFELDNEPDLYYKRLHQLICDNKNRVVAVGECGLDADRTNFCSMEIQKKYFEKQISLAIETRLPMFLHCRKSGDSLVSILRPYIDRIVGGVVHSFDGTEEEMNAILDLGLFIGINGCSLKTEENLKVASQIPLDKLLLETDAPWCDVRSSHAGSKHVKTTFPAVKPQKFKEGVMVKNRNEPCNIVQILEILAAIRNENPMELAEAVFKNTIKLFFSETN